jgi:hypothetical protein
MDRHEIAREIETVDLIVSKNVDVRDVQGLIAKGVWQLVLQVRLLVEGVENTK